MVDLVRSSELSPVVVSRSGLDTINYTLVTIEGLRSRGIEAESVIMNGNANAENLGAIEKYGKIEIIDQIPVFGTLETQMVSTFSRQQLDQFMRSLYFRQFLIWQ